MLGSKSVIGLLTVFMLVGFQNCGNARDFASTGGFDKVVDNGLDIPIDEPMIDMPEQVEDPVAEMPEENNDDNNNDDNTNVVSGCNRQDVVAIKLPIKDASVNLANGGKLTASINKTVNILSEGELKLTLDRQVSVRDVSNVHADLDKDLIDSEAVVEFANGDVWPVKVPSDHVVFAKGHLNSQASGGRGDEVKAWIVGLERMQLHGGSGLCLLVPALHNVGLVAQRD